MKRPIRDRVEKGVTDKVPSGPLGAVGEGNVIGAGGYIFTEATRTAFQLVPGLRPPGYKITSHNTSKSGDDEVHDFIIVAISEDIAEFVAQYFTSPGNLNFVASNTVLEETEVVKRRSGYTTYRIRVRLKEELTE